MSNMEKENIALGKETLTKGDDKEGDKRQTQTGKCKNTINLFVCNLLSITPLNSSSINNS